MNVSIKGNVEMCILFSAQWQIEILIISIDSFIDLDHTADVQ